jgi:hypothetical protein
MTDEPTDRAIELANRLRAEGHDTAAERVHGAAAGAILHTLRDACEFVLTAIEALDPKTQMMAEELRLEVEKRLN